MSRLRLLGIEVDALTIGDLQSLVVQLAREKSACIIANHNLHSVYLFHHDRRMRAFYEQADWIHIDGMSLVFLAKLLGKSLTREHRVTYVDWLRPLMAQAAEHRLRVFYLGAEPGIAERGAEILRSELPTLQIATHHGYFECSSDPLPVIQAFRPDILLVGMGMPRQEHWILENWQALAVPVVLPAGACIDYVAGAVPTAPRWMGQWGLEWLHRLWNDPRRLWRRYLVEPWFILRLIIRDLLGA